MLAELAQQLVHSLDIEGVPEIITAWQQVRVCQEQRAHEAALHAYNAEWSEAELPTDDAVGLHEIAVRKSLQIYASIAIGSDNLEGLGRDLDSQLDSWLRANIEAATRLCALRRDECLRALIQLQDVHGELQHLQVFDRMI